MACKKIILMISILFISACSGVSYYYKNSYTKLVDPKADFLVQYEGKPKYTLVDNMSQWEEKMLKDGYIMLGYSQQVGPQGTGFAEKNSVKWGSILKAERVLHNVPVEKSFNNRYFLATYWAKAKGFILGAYFEDMDKEVAEKAGFRKGALIKEIVKDSPADKAQLRRGDLVMLFNDEPVLDASVMEKLVKKHAGETVMLSIWSLDNGEAIKLEVKLNEKNW